MKNAKVFSAFNASSGFWQVRLDESSAIDTHLKLVLEYAHDNNLKLNKDKSQIRYREINYIGHILSKDVFKADPKKVEAVQK